MYVCRYTKAALFQPLSAHDIRGGPGRNQEAGAQSRSPMWPAGTEETDAPWL